jgi:hypothetical protein
MLQTGPRYDHSEGFGASILEYENRIDTVQLQSRGELVAIKFLCVHPETEKV